MKIIYAISDLHLGGDEVMAQQRAPHQLVSFLRDVAGHDGDMLVINGDVVDFLLESEGEQFCDLRRTQREACACLRRLFAREGVAVVMDALRDFVRADESREVVLLPGNHDLELLFPRVERLFRARLLLDVIPQTDEDEAWAQLELNELKSHRVRLHATHEPLPLCDDVVVVHGNMNDPHNRVDDEALRRDRNTMLKTPSHRARVESPYGSRLVQRVVNPAKARGCAFIDQLKPETAAALIASVLHPDLRDLLRPALSLLIRGQLSNSEQRFRSEDPTPAQTPDPELLQQVQLWEEELGAFDVARMVDELLEEIPAELLEPDPIRRGSADGESRGERALRESFVDRLWERLVWRLVRRYLDDHTFTLSTPRELWGEDACVRYAQRLHNRLKPKLILMGHTHLARNLALRPNCQYINTGTWVNVLALPHNIETFEGWQRFIDDLSRNRVTPRSAAYYAKLKIDQNRLIDQAELYLFSASVV